uniref:Immunoglobulin superfamily member 10 n=1 Tax=Varanus komodoensis TaxID=61221 RepID=A0A8D2LPH1_VARKO
PGPWTIPKVSVYDRGIYTCTANNPAGSDTVTIRLQVVAAPPIILEEKKQHVIENTGQSLRFPCTAKGNPYPDVHWVLFDGTVVKPLQYINGKLFLFPNGTLYIRNIASSDSGNYECIATSSTGSERRVVVLQVKHSDIIPRIAVSSQRLTQMSFGDNLLLNYGNPPPEIMWMLPNGTRLSSGFKTARYFLESNGTLVIYGLSNADSGKYRCAAKNKVGYIEKLIILEVGQKPTIFIHPKGTVKGISGESLFLHCLAGGNPKPNIIWTVPTMYKRNIAFSLSDILKTKGLICL